jgi:hypothetical protein
VAPPCGKAGELKQSLKVKSKAKKNVGRGALGGKFEKNQMTSVMHSAGKETNEKRVARLRRAPCLATVRRRWWKSELKNDERAMRSARNDERGALGAE